MFFYRFLFGRAVSKKKKKKHAVIKKKGIRYINQPNDENTGVGFCWWFCDCWWVLIIIGGWLLCCK